MLRSMILLSSTLLCACAGSPSVTYKPVKTAKDFEGVSDSFVLQRSVLNIASARRKGKDADGEDVYVTDFQIASVPRPVSDARYGIKGSGTWNASTSVTLTKIDNTDLISSIGTETVDERVNTITRVGGAIAQLITLVATFGAAADEPCFSDEMSKREFDLKPTAGEGSESFDVGAKGCVKIDYEAPSVTSVLRSEIPKGETPYYFYSSCRDATVTIHQTKSQPIVQRIRVSDPSRLDRVALPRKGKITHHTQCGTSVSTEPSTVSSAADVLSALNTQAKAIKDALEASGADEAASGTGSDADKKK